MHRSPARPPSAAQRQSGRAGARRHRASGHRQRGTSLIELLIAMVLLTLGITAMTNLQITALKLSHSAYLRSQAVVLSCRVLDAMRANRAAAAEQRYDRAFTDPVPTAEAAAGSIAAADLRDWLLSVENALRPYAGQAAIESTGTVPQLLVTVTLRWRDRLREERLGARRQLWESFSMVTEL